MLTKDAVLTKDYERLMQLIGADIIFLFGSVLSDSFREDSDIDIGIYFESIRYDKNSVCDTIIDFFKTERIDVAFLNKEIFISKLNYLKNYYEELKSFESLPFLQYIEDKIKLFIEFYGKYLKILGSKVF